jgi:nanoRNase/pAp phosphatase (c-di-AMP/oligoRNAs hydrolase)
VEQRSVGLPAGEERHHDAPPGIQPTMTAEPQSIDIETTPEAPRRNRSERLLETLALSARIVVVSHVNPDPDSLASMLGIKALVEAGQPGKPVVLTCDGMIARSENRAMVELIPIPVVPVETVNIDAATAVVMVDTQPHTGRRYSEAAVPQVVLDHHETGGDLSGVLFSDIRTHLGATSTMITGYLLEQRVMVPPPMATALLYGIESETTGYPREASSLDDGALIWLFPRADKDLLARIRNPKLPQSHFATFQSALANAFVYDKLIFSWCGVVSQPDIIAEIADFFIRFDQVDWALAAGVFEHQVKLSLRASQLGAAAGEILQAVVNGMGNAGGHDRRAGGAIALAQIDDPAIESTLRMIRRRLLGKLGKDEQQGRRLLFECPVIPAP